MLKRQQEEEEEEGEEEGEKSGSHSREEMPMWRSKHKTISGPDIFSSFFLRKIIKIIALAVLVLYTYKYTQILMQSHPVQSQMVYCKHGSEASDFGVRGHLHPPR